MKAEGLKKICRFSRYYIGVILGVMVFSILVEMFRKDGSFKVVLDKSFFYGTFLAGSIPSSFFMLCLCDALWRCRFMVWRIKFNKKMPYYFYFYIVTNLLLACGLWQFQYEIDTIIYTNIIFMWMGVMGEVSLLITEKEIQNENDLSIEEEVDQYLELEEEEDVADAILLFIKEIIPFTDDDLKEKIKGKKQKDEKSS